MKPRSGYVVLLGVKSEKEKNRWFGYLRDGMFLVVLVVAITTYQTWSHASAGTAAPAFDLMRVAGGQQSSAALRGKPTAVYFWAPWCGVCEASSDNIGSVRSALGEDANVVSIVVEHRDMQSVHGFMQRNDVDYPVLVGDSRVRDAYGVEAFPTMYFLDPEGRIVTSVVGYTTQFGIRARLWWAGL